MLGNPSEILEVEYNPLSRDRQALRIPKVSTTTVLTVPQAFLGDTSSTR